MPGGHASLQALQAGQALQGLRLDANHTPHSQGSASQAFKPESQPGNASYSLFKPPASLPQGSAGSNQVGNPLFMSALVTGFQNVRVVSLHRLLEFLATGTWARHAHAHAQSSVEAENIRDCMFCVLCTTHDLAHQEFFVIP